MIQKVRKVVFILFLVAALGGIAWAVKMRLDERPGGRRSAGEPGPAPVEVAPIERGRIELRRTFSGTLEASARFVVAPKVGGRIEVLDVDLSDPVNKGQVVAELDDDEYVQASVQAEAELAVANAKIVEADNALKIAQREMKRIETLRVEGVAADSQFDSARADQSAKEAALAVARAQAQRAEAAIETTRIRRAYTQVKARWNEDDNTRFVAQRYVEAGDTVSANTPLLSIVRLNPIKGVVFVTEKDYARLSIGQQVALREQNLIEGRSALEARRLRLLRLINPNFDAASQRAVTTSTSPRIEAAPINDTADRLALADLHRPDLNEARLRLRQRRLETIVTRNGVLPRLDLFVAVGKTGFSDTFSDSFKQLDGDTYDFTAGVSFSHLLGNRAAEARDRAALASRAQAAAAIENLRQLVRLDVLLAINEVDRARKQITATTTTRQLQERTTAAERLRFDAGAITSLDLARAQRDLLEIRIREVEAVVRHRIALVNLYLAEGSLLDRRGVVVGLNRE